MSAVPAQALQWQVHLLTRPEDFEPHRAGWDGLNDRLYDGHAMLRSDFVQGLLRHFWQPGIHLCIGLSAGPGGGEARGMCLLMRRRVHGGVWTSFLPSQTQIGPSLLAPTLDLRSLIRALPGFVIELDLLCNDPLYGDLRHLPKTQVQTMPHALTMSVSLRDGFEAYWAQRPRKLIQNMRRYLRRLQTEAGDAAPIRLDIIQTPEALREAVTRYGELESRGWKGREGTAVRADNLQGHFYGEVMATYGARGEAMVYELWQGDELLASRMLLRHGSTVVMLKTAFSEPHERLAPGRILLMRTLEDLFERCPDGMVEFYTNADADLLAWSTSQRWINHVSLYRSALFPLVFGLARRSVPRWLRGGGAGKVGPDAMAQRSRASVEVYSHPRDLPADALALMAEGEQRYMEFSPDWYGLLIDAVFAHKQGARLYVLRRQGRVLAVLPTAMHSGDEVPTGREVAALANYYTSLYSPQLADDLTAEDLLPLVLALRRQSRGTPAYRFAPMDPQSREFGLLREALSLGGLVPSSYFAFGNWYQPVQEAWSSYLQARSGELRSTLKRKGKRFVADGGRLEILRGGDDLERGIASYQQVYAQSWKVPEPYTEFVPGLIRLCARRGWLRLGLAWIGEQPVAAQIWIISGGRAHIYKLAYDEAFKAAAAGTLLTAHLMEEAIDRDGVTEIDYLIGDDPYKKTWMSQRRERYGLIAYDPRTLRGLIGLARQWLGQWLRKLRPAEAAPPPAPPKSRADNPDA